MYDSVTMHPEDVEFVEEILNNLRDAGQAPDAVRFAENPKRFQMVWKVPDDDE